MHYYLISKQVCARIGFITGCFVSYSLERISGLVARTLVYCQDQHYLELKRAAILSNVTCDTEHLKHRIFRLITTINQYHNFI